MRGNRGAQNSKFVWRRSGDVSSATADETLLRTPCGFLRLAPWLDCRDDTKKAAGPAKDAGPALHTNPATPRTRRRCHNEEPAAAGNEGSAFRLGVLAGFQGVPQRRGDAAGGKSQPYRRAMRSYSFMVRSISSRAASAAERMPWTRRRKSSGLEARSKASSKVMRLREKRS